ncbi:MAG TPA: hypothetical protein DEA97_08445 [Bacteroidales bacterium]|nr:hypothetical protein [Bacteroidales bacterium]
MHFLFGNRQINNFNTCEWLKDVLKRLTSQKANKLDELLPRNRKKIKNQIAPQ